MPEDPQNHGPDLGSKKRPGVPELWFKDQQLKHAIFKMQLQSRDPKTLTIGEDPFSLLSDETLSLILSKLRISQHSSNSLVCKRWLSLQSRLVRSLSLLDWNFLESGRLTNRFPNLTEINLLRACFQSYGYSGILLSHKLVSIHLGSELGKDDGFIGKEGLLDSHLVDRGLKLLASGCPNLRKLVLINASGEGLDFVAKECVTLQELEIHCCGDTSLKGIYGFKNLQILKLVGSVDGLYGSVVTDIGLTVLAQGCRRLVKLELSGCEGSYDGIKAIGQCCQMLEELTLCDHRMDGGWLSALSYCENLKTMKLQSCNDIDSSPGPDEHLGSCPTFEELHLERCHIRDKRSIKALFLVCKSVRVIVFQDCWGLEDDIFQLASLCRGVKSLSLEGCSLLTVKGLDSVVPFWSELQTLSVVSCNNIKNSEVTAEMAAVFSGLKELKWRPDSKSLLSSSLAGIGIGKRGGKFFRRA
ncbi:hypothetical protein Nepgr_002459 [Nepenthes gracilis]|uniref:F-box protein n=1 Tax=Nepenthes gracilis TaxID=150966 RepID=A0AAD3RYG0_NEPGR|nr:hypothetical protein Nepgr_002459 [Nepenthes gracilis]